VIGCAGLQVVPVPLSPTRSAILPQSRLLPAANGHIKPGASAHLFEREGGGQPEEQAVGEQHRHAKAQQLVLKTEVQLEEAPHREDLPVNLRDANVPPLEAPDLEQ